jgi:hypothetical protein
MEEIKRDLSNAPISYTHKAVKQWMIDHGAMGVLSVSAVSLIVGVSKRTVKDAERAGKLKTIDKCTYSLDAVVEWLVQNPRYIAQDTRYFKVTEETLNHVKAIILTRYQGLLKLWNDDVDDLAQETCYRLSTTPMGASCSESLVIIRMLNKIWHSKDIQNRRVTVPLSSVNSREVVL